MFVHYMDGDKMVAVTESTPLPTTSAGGGGMQASDITANAPLTWDAQTKTFSIDLSAYAKTSDLSAYAKTSDLSAYAKTSDLAPIALTNAQKAANVGDADSTDTTTLATSIDAIRDALVAAKLMNPPA